MKNEEQACRKSLHHHRYGWRNGARSGANLRTRGRWEEYKYRDAGFAISAPFMPIPAPPSPDEPNTRAYGIKYNNRSAVMISAGALDMWENLPDKEKLQRMKDLMVQGSSSKLVSEKEISLDGNPGIEYEIEGSSEHYRTRYYLVNGKFFACSRLLRRASPSSPTQTGFLIRCVC